ncbi:hypothetical protein IEQ34_007816 [Dendrobium chrysotoxum]|uniref:Protein CYCLOPS n=1 Tax=Dendrobium chrysotoxum TaxID=161865 RepID=A0AAV7H5Z3_DENCH|nr:hypothetical protein IEQ34_007816 [Dendrobium chrysotoxum]
MEMEGSGFSELLRNTTEEILIKSMMDNPIGNPVLSMEMLGFKNIMQPFRADSEELFNGWIESPASAITHRTHQASTRISADLGLSQQNAVSFTKKSSDLYSSHQNIITCDEHFSHPGQYSLRNSEEDGTQASNFYLAKAGFSQPLIRSRSSELRRKYAAMQDSQVKVIPQPPHNMPTHGIHRFQQNFTDMSNFCNNPMAEIPNQLQNIMSPSKLSTSSFNPPIATADMISSVVNMLKGTLEPKKIDRNVDEETVEGRSYDMLTSQDAACSGSSIQGVGDETTVLHILSPVHVPAPGSFATLEKSLELSVKGYPTEANHIQMSTMSREPSQSDSSTAAPALSTGFEVCDGTAQSKPAFSTCSYSGKQVGYGSLELESRDKVGKEDSTKKRRVERSRKMAEAKERNSTPSISSDMQGILRRWENLEKEVRSLKLNLSFMNRKDSEQTKQIEELLKQNEELTKEKERLLEEIEQNIS